MHGGQRFEAGATLGRFRIIEPIGSGGMGIVYTALDPELGRSVAIKVLHETGEDTPDQQARARLLREAQAMARLAHPNVVPVHEIGSGEPLFIVMELVVGGTLRQWLAEPRSVAEIVEAFEQAGRGLAAAHDAGLVHRDFKPENILRGDDGRVRVVDFGLVASRAEQHDRVIASSSLDLALTHTGIVLGTPAYMAPEQHRGELTDARSDQFSFAVALYEALYGERPFAGTTYRELVRNVYAGTIRPPPRGTSVPPEIRAALVRALSVDPADRYPTVAALLADVTRPPPRRRRPHAPIVIAAVAAIGASVGIVTISSSGTSPRPAKDVPAPVVQPVAAPRSMAAPTSPDVTAARPDAMPTPISEPVPAPADTAPPRPAVINKPRPPEIPTSTVTSTPTTTPPEHPDANPADRRRRLLDLEE